MTVPRSRNERRGRSTDSPRGRPPRSGPATRPALIDAGVIAAVVIAVVVAAQLGHGGTPLAPNPVYFDIAIYHGTLDSWLHGSGLYSPTSLFGLQFTYPPFAALVLTWVALLPVHVAGAVMAASGLLAEGVVFFAAWRGARPRWDRTSVATAALLCLAASPLFEPVKTTLSFGQVNLGLLAMVMLDRLAVPPRYRGLLTGIAAAVKLTPAIFVLYALSRRRWREAALGAVGAAVCTLLGFVLLPADSERYWTSYLLDFSRVGGGTRIDNQSIAPVVARALHVSSATATTASTAVYVAALGLALALGFLAARAADRRGAWITEAAAVGVTALLVSPVSWTHHWVWVVPLTLGLLVEGRTRVSVLAALAVGWVFLDDRLARLSGALSPVSGVPLRAEVTDGSYVWVGFLVLGYLATRRAPAGTLDAPAAPAPRYEAARPEMAVR